MWHNYSHLSRAVILWSHNSPLSHANLDSTPELAGIPLLLIHRGFQSHLGFTMKVFAWKVLAAYSSGYFDYPSWSTSIPRRTSSSVPCCSCPALSLTCYKTLLSIFVELLSFLKERKRKTDNLGTRRTSCCEMFIMWCRELSKAQNSVWVPVTISKMFIALTCVILHVWIGLPGALDLGSYTGSLHWFNFFSLRKFI